jgi:hypothetical protein
MGFRAAANKKRRMTTPSCPATTVPGRSEAAQFILAAN